MEGRAIDLGLGGWSWRAREKDLPKTGRAREREFRTKEHTPQMFMRELI